MTDLFWPGDHLAGDLMSDAAFLTAMLAVEQAWLDGLVDAGVAPTTAGITLPTDVDLDTVARQADSDGNPVSGLVALLRDRTPDPASRWIHRGLTSQDVVDTALMLCLRDVLTRLAEDVRAQVDSLVALTEGHRHTPALARTLTQPALPTTVGTRTAAWLTGLLDAADPLDRTEQPAQLGGAVGTLAAVVELTGSVPAAVELTSRVATRLGLTPAHPWHTTRAPLTRIGDLLAGLCDAWGHLAADVATGGRAEIGEFAEGQGGGSSTMPHKNNPVRSVLIRRAALTAGPLAGTLHTAAATNVDERADGAWHAEWATIATLARRTVVAGAHTTDLLGGLRVDADRAAANLAAAGDLAAEQATMATLVGRQPQSTYLGVADYLVDAALDRAASYVNAPNRKDAP
ncbi:3-carboxy-cis,cis-muconate cycloisomerase [Mycobacterium yunnanensis]|uniref:3-carboxy-cis,cis-muconate cycloisomerase n=1 Tax=Mycobacterium yunnanensis TaxID=368477 RepID=A0A9X2YZ97_9MYCO|nr:lyase family protein [Mycobacterium yunnanensis]MCV7419522.1 3-carboxy-cis,cis-muconate cycloisomerase [Mycobacterium yunnanensis]